MCLDHRTPGKMSLDLEALSRSPTVSVPTVIKVVCGTRDPQMCVLQIDESVIQ